jgi:hypothetical protein
MLRHIRSFVAAVLLSFATIDAVALEYTDAWVPLGEDGSGVFLVQSEAFVFLAFYVFDQNNQPIWYSCQLLRDANGVTYSGGLYASTGTYYALPWNPAAAHTTAIGTCTFAPADIYTATLTYTLTGAPPIVKTIRRYALLPYNLAGNYSGSMAGSISGCNDPADNDAAFRARYGLAVAQVGDAAATLTFTFVDMNHSGIVCTVSGPLTHLGRLYQLNGQLSCTGPGQSPGVAAVTINSLHPTGQGIEGHLTGGAGSGCTGSLHFSAVLNVNN